MKSRDRVEHRGWTPLAIYHEQGEDKRRRGRTGCRPVWARSGCMVSCSSSSAMISTKPCSRNHLSESAVLDVRLTLVGVRFPHLHTRAERKESRRERAR